MASDMVGLGEQMSLLWELFKGAVIVPMLRMCVWICVGMFLMLFVDWVYITMESVMVKLFWKKPEERYKWIPMKAEEEDDDLPMRSSNGFPMVLVQIPMFNEREVYKISIGAACNLSWPADKLLIQVLDDSTDLIIKDMVKNECLRWAGKGINIVYQNRERRRGYKAGALKEGLKHDYIQKCEYVAIFDADFQPEPDFLLRTVPFLMHNPDIALVQARWRFVNANECFLTRMQETMFDYHFTVEQEIGSAVHDFFGFNGTGAIWRMKAIEESGGWRDRTTVEDLDISVRAGLKGWKFLYLGDLQVKSELPGSLTAFRIQQHRWWCGSANLFRKMMFEIVTNKRVSLYKKFYVIYTFFIVRKFIGPLFTLFFYNVCLPLTVLIPEVDVPKWVSIYIPCIIMVINSMGNLRLFHYYFTSVLFEHVLSFHRTKAVFIGLLEAKRANEWVVTEKLGDALKDKVNKKSVLQKKAIAKLTGDRIQLEELGFAVFHFACGCYGFLYGKNNYYIFLFLQAITFAITGFGGYVGAIIHGS